MITRAGAAGHELQVFESKLTAVGFGFFVPFFFVTSGIDFDLDALGSAGSDRQAGRCSSASSWSSAAPRRCCSTAACSAPATAPRSPSTRRPSCRWSSRSRRSRSTTGHMRTSTAAGLVGAAMLSTLIFPFVGLALRKGARGRGGEQAAADRPPGRAPPARRSYDPPLPGA